MTTMTQAEMVPTWLPRSSGSAPQGLELRHLRYFVAVADAGTFTHAAERMYIAQPTLSQQIRRLEQIIGTSLLQRRREGLQLTQAGTVLLENARTILSLVDHGMSRTRQAAGVGRPRLRFVIPAYLPESLAVEAASRLRSMADAAGVGVTWMDIALGAEFSPIRQRQADAGLDWTDPASPDLPAPLDVMHLGEFEPDVWVPETHPAASRGVIGLDELARMDVIHGPRHAGGGTYDRWLAVLRAQNPDFDFADPPFRQSMSMTLAFAASGSSPAAVLTGPCHRIRGQVVPAQSAHATGAGTWSMVPVRVGQGPLTAPAGLVWNGDLPRQLQQLLFDTADGFGLTA
jgi:DNA-binding transcriptional LysR family regulator